MNLLAFLIGTGLTTMVGWLTVGLVQGRTPVLTRYERLAYGVILGPTLAMFVVFVSHITGITKFDLTGFLLPIGMFILLLGALSLRSKAWKASAPASDVFVQHSPPRPTWMKVGVVALLCWTALKLFAGAYDLTIVPTYWDDSFNNWNMRGKMFFVDQELTLSIPIGNGIVQSAQGVSSYPPELSMMKTWLSVLRGSWQEPLINSVHILWSLGLIGALFLTLRRRVNSLVSSLGIYLLVSLPLFLIQASNPYADVYLASHLFLCIGALLGVTQAKTEGEIASFMKLFFLCLGLLAITKNEGLVLHIPLLLLAAAWITWDLIQKKRISPALHRRTVLVGISMFLAILLPWLLFKWTNGLTFGNAKSVSGVSLGLNQNVLSAIWFHFTHEPNWLFLPLALALAFVYHGGSVGKLPIGLLKAFVVLSVAGQFALFLFVPSLATEAIMQTGLSRGLLQIAPVAVLLLMFLVTEKLTKEPQSPPTIQKAPQ